VYNLEVEDYHTYFVGDVPILVHNYKTEYDIYAAGTKTKKPSGKKSDFGFDGNADIPDTTLINMNMKPSDSKHPFGGASTNEKVENITFLKNKLFYLLEAGKELPPDIGLNRDEINGHNTLYPLVEMTLGRFYELIQGLEWIPTDINTYKK
ncbi:MAG: hypothetical protein NC235_15220, partial [Clostridiales bacterium]|nr:hypothetical protein [Clostridiales bacterium]